MTLRRAVSVPRATLGTRDSLTLKETATFTPQPRPPLPWQIEMVALSSLKPAKRNARTHSKKQILQLANSIDQFDATVPIVADERGRIVAGHGRYAAAKLLRRTHFPVIRVSHLNETQIRAYALADNKLAENAGWDREILNFELRELQIALPKIGLNLDITGFSPGDVDSIMLDFPNEQPNAADTIPEIETRIVAKTGDIFLLGAHRIMVADARDAYAYNALMGVEIVEMAFLDPPYNVKINGHVGGRGRTKHREFEHASGEKTPAEYTQFLKDCLTLCARHTADGAISFVCIDWRHVGELNEAGAAAYDEHKNICVWAKTTPGQGSFYRSQHELIFVYKRGRAPHLNTFELGQHGRSRSNVWTYPGANMFRAGRMDELKMHPTVKPVALVADAMRDCSRRGAIILDAFAGSGTTIMAAEQIGRRALCMEIDPQYVDVAIRRWQRFTGKDAVLGATQQTFHELSEGSHRRLQKTTSVRSKSVRERR